MKPWKAPIKAPSTSPRPRATIHMKRAAHGDAQDVRQEAGHQQGVDHGNDADLRADRQVDVAGHDDEHHARGHDGHAAGLHGQRDHVGGVDELAAGQDVEPEQDGDERDEHAEETHVDLGRGEQAPQAGPRGAGRLVRRGVGDTGHRATPGSPSMRRRPASRRSETQGA